MLRYYFIFILTLFFLLPHTTKAQLTNMNRSDFQYNIHNLWNIQWDNPAMMYHYPVKNFTEASLNYSNSKTAKLQNPVNGDQQELLKFNANSIVKKNNIIWYGQAYYNYGINFNVIWNNIMDYDLIAPYNMGDTVKAKQKHETYYFKGGYAIQLNKTIIGVCGTYRAATLYGQIDPRPYNTVSELNLGIGSSFAIGKSKNVGLNVNYLSYKQNSTISNFRVSGTHKHLYLLGFGLNHAFFSEVKFEISNFYELTGLELSMQLFPINEKGVVINLKSGHYSCKLDSKEYKTINKLQTNRIESEIGYSWNSSNLTHKIMLKSDYRKKKGWEYEYIMLGGNFLHRLPKYKQTQYNAKIAWLSHSQLNKFQHYQSIQVDYSGLDEEHLNPLAFQRFNNLIYSIKVGISQSIKKSQISLKINTSYRQNISKELQKSNLAFEGANEFLVAPTYNYLTTNKSTLSSKLRLDRKIKENYGFFIKCGYYTEIFKEYKPLNEITIALGLTI